MTFRKFASFAAPALALGLLVVSQAIGRPQGPNVAARQQARANRGFQQRGSLGVRQQLRVPGRLGVRVSGPGAGTINSNVRLVQNLLNRENAFLYRDQRLFFQQNAVNIRLQRLAAVVPATQRQALQLQRAIGRALNQFTRLQGQINQNAARAVQAFSQFAPRIDQALNNLSQFASNPAIAGFIDSAFNIQILQEQQLQAILNRPPATPFEPIFNF